LHLPNLELEQAGRPGVGMLAPVARIFLTGATACVGHHLAYALCAAGHQLDLLVRDPARLRPLPDGARYQVIQGDLSTEAGYASRLAEADYLVHAAADRGSVTSRGMDVNLEGTRKLLAGLNPDRVRRIIYFSSSSLLRSDGSLLPADLFSDHAYLASKFRGLQEVRNGPLASRVVVLYPTVVFGWDPGHPPAHDSISLRAILGWAWLLRRVRIDAAFHYLHARDIGRITERIIAQDKAGEQVSGAYILGNPPLTYAQGVEAATGRPHRPWITLSGRTMAWLAPLFRFRLSRYDRYALSNPRFVYATTDAASFGLERTHGELAELISAHRASPGPDPQPAS